MTEATVTPQLKPTKAWIGTIGSLLTLILPYAIQASELLPPPWPAIVGAVVALLTGLGVYKVENKPTGKVVVDNVPPVGTTYGDIVTNDVRDYTRGTEKRRNPFPRPRP